MPRTSGPAPAASYSFFTAVEYRRQLLRHIRKSKAGDRLLLMSMAFEPTEPEIAEIMQETEAAAARGVCVTLAVDAHSFLVSSSFHTGQYLPHMGLRPARSPYFRHKLAILERINACPGSRADIINIPARALNLPISGRSHIKAALVNDRVFLGGCNLQGTQTVDMMVGWQSNKDADMLHAILGQIIQGKHAGRALAGIDRNLTLGQDANVFIDSGVKRQSRILDEALKLIDAAEDWLVITCQFFPNSITARHLMLASNRGVKVEVIYSHPMHLGLIGGLGQQVSILRERTRVPKSLFKHALNKSDPLLHAKLIACDKGVMIGSHNYVRAGVILGTAEIAFQSSSETLAREAVTTLHRALGQAEKN